MKKDTSKKPAAPKTAKKITCTVGKQPIYEGGQSYAPGAEISLTPARAKALGTAVTSTN